MILKFLQVGIFLNPRLGLTQIIQLRTSRLTQTATQNYRTTQLRSLILRLPDAARVKNTKNKYSVLLCYNTPHTITYARNHRGLNSSFNARVTFVN